MSSIRRNEADVPLLCLTGAMCEGCQSQESLSRKLLSCGICKGPQYCNRECQQQHWKSHKKICKDIKVINEVWLEIHNSPMGGPSFLETLMHFSIQEIAARKFQSKSNADYFPLFLRLARQGHCEECKLTRKDTIFSKPVALTCCKSCHWGWKCQDHLGTASHSEEVCKLYRQSNSLNLVAAEYSKENGFMVLMLDGKKIEFIPDYEYHESYFPQSWQDYHKVRNFPPFPPGMIECNTDNISQYLTAAYSLQKLNLNSLETVIIHIVGFKNYERMPNKYWEELCHLLDIRDLEVVFIGPDWKAIDIENGDEYIEIPMKMCGNCTTRQVRSKYSFFKNSYESFKTSKNFKIPTIAITYNPDFINNPIWEPSLEILLEQTNYAPFVFTSSNEYARETDFEIVNACASSEINCSFERNPFTSLVPIINVDPRFPPNTFLYRNHFVSIVKSVK